MSGNGLTYSDFIPDKVLPTTNITALSGNNATSSDATFSTPTPSRMMGGRKNRRKSSKKRKGGRKNKSKSKKDEMELNTLMLGGSGDESTSLASTGESGSGTDEAGVVSTVSDSKLSVDTGVDTGVDNGVDNGVDTGVDTATATDVEPVAVEPATGVGSTNVQQTNGGKRRSRRNKKCKKGGKKSNSKKNSRRRRTNK